MLVMCSITVCLPSPNLGRDIGEMLMNRQVVKNVTLQSCEGLSLPFLINWLFGMFPRLPKDQADD